MPVIEGQEVLHKGGHNRDLLLCVVVHDLDSQLSNVDTGAIVVDLLGDKAVVVGE